MIERFPYGRAPFWLTVLAALSTVLVLFTREWSGGRRAELAVVTFAPNHMESYKDVIPAFERKHGVRVSIQLVDQRALEQRLKNAVLAGTPVPDLVEMGASTFGFFIRGPVADVGFLDLTERLAKEELRPRLVESRLSLWTTRGHVFALPHDVHPVMLMYRADLVEALGIDVNALETWEDFAAVGRKVVKDLDGDGVPDRYMIDLPASAAWGMQILLLQQGISFFDEQGRPSFNQERTIDTIIWYVRQLFGPERIAYDCSAGGVGGQTWNKAVTDGLALFYVAPDWRTHGTTMEVPGVAGKMKVMPLPAWERGGRRTSVWGGSGLAITKATAHPELAWELAKTLYFDKAELGRRFRFTNILPALRDAWEAPEFHEPKAFFSGQKLGALYAAIAPDAPADWSSPFRTQGDNRVADAMMRGAAYYRKNGERGLREYLRQELASVHAHLQRYMARNVLTTR